MPHHGQGREPVRVASDSGKVESVCHRYLMEDQMRLLLNEIERLRGLVYADLEFQYDALRARFENEDRPLLAILYRNHRGEVAWRAIKPGYIWHGFSEFHPNKSAWILAAYDAGKEGPRDFLFADILACRPLGPGCANGPAKSMPSPMEDADICDLTGV